MLPFYKSVLGPILLLQARRLKRTAMRLPEAAGPRRGLEFGGTTEMPPLHVLVVGDSSAAGVGVEHQERALAQPLARLLAARLGRPVAWQLVAQSGVNTREALALLSATELDRADIVVTALGVNDVTSQRSPHQFLHDFLQLIDEVKSRTGATRLVASGLPPMRLMPALPQPLRWYLGRCAARLDAALRQWTDPIATARYVSLEWAVEPQQMARDGFHPGAVQYRRWAEMICERIVELHA